MVCLCKPVTNWVLEVSHYQVKIFDQKILFIHEVEIHRNYRFVIKICLIGERRDRPAWLAFDKQVLCFDAYFQESITERPQEQYRIRKCRVYFYPEDDTVQGLLFFS
jgi:hypothetical protein